MRSPIAGTSSETPKPKSTTIAIVRAMSSGSPSASITYTRATVAKVKESARPVTTPSGLRRPPVTPTESTAGRIGSTQGESAVPAPATNANSISRAIE